MKARSISAIVAFLLLLGFAGGCGGDDSAPSTSNGGSSGGISGSGDGAGNGGSAGSTGVAGKGGAAGSEADAARPAIDAGSTNDGPSTDAPGEGGLVAIAAELDKFRLECPCIDADHFGLAKLDNCDMTPAVDRQTYTKKVGGDPNVIYDVTLHVRGDTEPNTYINGKLEQNRFYIGGETSTPGYTSYMLSIAEPKQVYFFNYNPTTSHIHFLIDYQVVIPMKGGTTVTFDVNGGKSVPDGHGVSNRESLVVPGIPPAPDPFNGQLVQFDVVSVKAQ